jgi:tetratricopeptide (TPR) repeat protein
MRVMTKSIFPLMLLFFLNSCSTISKVKINSSPDKAEVKVTTNDGETKSLGTTPLELNGKDIYSSASRMSVIHISKDGFESQNVFIAQESSLESYNINIKLRTKSEDVKNQDIKSRQEKLAKNIAMSNNLINKKRYDEAERVLTSVTQDFPYVSVSYDLLGNIAYLKRDFRAAINYYEKSYQLNPENSETKTMIDKLKRMINLDQI